MSCLAEDIRLTLFSSKVTHGDSKSPQGSSYYPKMVKTIFGISRSVEFKKHWSQDAYLPFTDNSKQRSR